MAVDSGNTAGEKSGFLRRFRERPLSSKHQQLAEYLARHYRTAASLTAAQLAAVMGTSEATVVRLARELGYDGFPDLRRQLHRMIREDLNSLELLERERTRADQGSDTLARLVCSEEDHLRALAIDVSRADFARLVNGLVDAARVYIVGHRASASLAHFFGYTLAKVHPDVVTLFGEHDAFYDAFRRVPERSLMVAIGFARYPRETIELMEFARHERVTIAAITDRALSPLARRADFSLVVQAEPVSFVDSHCAPQALIAAVLVEYGMVARERTEAMLERFERVVELRGLFHGGE